VNHVSTKNSITSSVAPEPPPAPDMVWISGGVFRMGSEEFYPEEAPVHSVRVDGFWMDKYQVTNRDFAEFVRATGYVTVAERAPNPDDYPGAPPENLVPGSLVFHMTSGPVNLEHINLWWDWTPGANWRRPEGSRSHIRKRKHHPVVHICYEDAAAYAAWAGKALPTEAEWEFAARGGIDGAHFVWGDEHFPAGKPAANTWQGEFPWQNLETDGFAGTSPVGAFAPNDYGLYDMAGNVWEWTADWWTESHAPGTGDAAGKETGDSCCMPHNPRGGSEAGSYDPAQPQFRIPRKVVKGGSYLCAPNYCLRYRPAARRPQMVDTGATHIGFRCIVR